jgi:transcriptional regulator with XRE-family HTH domain
MIDNKALARLIKKKYGSMNAFAEAVGVSRQYISLMVKGERTPSLQKLLEFADKLGVDVDVLLVKGVALAA